jgi:hypothetical protein
MKKDNLKSFREEKVKRNTLLIKRAIDHLKAFGGDISMSSVSKVTYDIGKENEQGLSVPAISKNKTYRALVQEAQNTLQGKMKQPLSSKTLKDMSQAELIAEIYKLRISNLEIQKEFSVLKEIIAEYDISTSAKQVQKKPDKECLFALQHALQALLAQDILYIEQNTFDVKLTAFGTLIIKGSIYKKYFNDKVEINESNQ